MSRTPRPQVPLKDQAAGPGTSGKEWPAAGFGDSPSRSAESRKPGYQSMPDAAPDSPSSSGSGASAPYGIAGGRRAAGDPLAFTSSRMEAAFCAYLGRVSSECAKLVRWLQLAAWLTALGKWLYQSATGHPYASQTVLEWAAGGTLVFLVVVAECTSLRQLRGEHRFVRHEMLKAQNSLIMMVLKMCGTGIFVRKHAVSTPQVRAIIGGASLVFDRFRLSQALLLSAFNFLTFIIMEVANSTAGATSGEIAREVVNTVIVGLVAPLAALALLEGRARMRFLSLHTHLEDPQALLPVPWQRLGAALHWAELPRQGGQAAPDGGGEAAATAPPSATAALDMGSDARAAVSEVAAAPPPGGSANEGVVPRSPQRIGHRRGEGSPLNPRQPATPSAAASTVAARPSRQ